MGKLPTIAWTTMVLASLGLAGCKCCQKCSSCPSGACSASTGGHAAGQQQYHTMPQGTPTAMPPASSYRSMPAHQGMTKPTLIETSHETAQPMPAGQPSGWNNPPRPSASQPARTIHTVPTQPVNPVSYQADDTGDDLQPAASPLQQPSSAMPRLNSYPQGVPSMSEQMKQQGVAPAPRPPESW
jgi:hypothetical protein